MADTISKDIAANLKILKAAEEVFAEKGFDGARVDEIAKRAGVNKALIYYYFASKDQILEELSKKHLQELIDSKEKMLRDVDLQGGLTREAVADFVEYTLDTLMGERKNFFGIVLIEALKSSGDVSFFKLMNQMYDDGLARLNKMGYPIDGEKLKTFAVFFGIIPVVFYITMWEKWAEFNRLDKEKVKGAFIEGLTDVEYSLFLNNFKMLFDENTIKEFYREPFSLTNPQESGVPTEG